jgi:hypothetical protein
MIIMMGSVDIFYIKGWILHAAPPDPTLSHPFYTTKPSK